MDVGWEIVIGSFILSSVASSSIALKILHCISHDSSLFPFMLLVTFCRAFPKKRRKKVRSYARLPHKSQEKTLLCGQGVKKRVERERGKTSPCIGRCGELYDTTKTIELQRLVQLLILASNVKRSNKQTQVFYKSPQQGMLMQNTRKRNH